MRRRRASTRPGGVTLVGALAGTLVGAGPTGAPAAQEAPPGTPECADRSFAYVRSEERASAYADRACDRDRFDRLRYLPLGDSLGDAVLSVGGELRGRYELYTEEDFGGAPADGDGTWRGRAYLLLGLEREGLGRAVVSLRAAGQADTDQASAAPIDGGGLDLQEGFLEIGEAAGLALRLGRQEISFPLRPPSRLLSARDGPNVRRSWDAGRLIWNGGGWRTDAFYARAVEIEDGSFDDVSDGDIEFWGVHAAQAGPGFDLYYYGLADEAPPFQGIGDPAASERRHTFGLRYTVAPEAAGLDVDAEAAWQTGSVGDQDVRAGFAAMDAGWTTDTALGWRLGGQLFASTGDDDPGDDRVGTFNELFPSGAYLNGAALLRGQNILSAAARIDLSPCAGCQLSGFYTHYWRTERADGLYAQSGRLQRAGTPQDGRAIGGYLGLRGRYPIDHRNGVVFQAGRFFPGAFLEDTGGSDETVFLRIDYEWQL